MSNKFTTPREIQITRSKSGSPCLWESGGGWSNTGSATIVAGSDASPVKPIYIKGRGDLACNKHALIPVRIGSVVVDADHHRQDFRIAVWQIQEIGNETASAALIAEFDQGEWEFCDSAHPEFADHLTAAIDAAQRKATCYHCREPHYVAE
jgi:hypothetical protein